VALVCDTSPLLAAIDRSDPHHQECVRVLAATREEHVVPTLVLSELDYFCRKLGLDDAWLAFLDDIDAGALRVEHPTAADLRRARELQAEYRDLAIGVVDASVIALVERLGEPKVATLDHRHFATVRPRHVPVLQLLP
jgi:uncharacterized protein